MFIVAVQSSLVNFSAVKIDTTDIFIFAGIILAAIGAIWGIRKMVALGYLSSVPGHWQKRYEREQDLADYKEFRDEGGFERGMHLGGGIYFGGGFGSDSEDDLEDEYIGSVGDKSWYYDKDGDVYSNYSEEIEVGYFESYEAREEYREGIMNYIDNYQEFDTEWERIEWRNHENEWVDSIPYDGPGPVDEDEDLNIGWEK